ncbi:K Homology type 1 isoform A [Micractinium conductrix]|uniref:K Homology type 1 isoform A n=1 Tax=Micractinium conductrix TaxID=554055 RepID=A0A2P6V926_9CHLO|nr:K Homology type 1 isoform A [Micractinium conductrix]|eukprot:PSC70588.1 K Homology type 1 isoform A [Micractinium conductrix]
MESPFATAGGGGFAAAPAGPPLLAELPPLDAHSLASARSSLDDCLLQAVAAAPRGIAPAPAGAHTLPRHNTISNPLDASELLSHANDLLTAPPPPAAAAGGARGVWVQPSGRRQSGEGCEDVEQAVLLAVPSPSGGALLRVTLLAAGFVIGPSGASVRDICKATQTDIKSSTADPDEHCSRSCRVFRVEGPRNSVADAVTIICDAVDRYKELCEGKYAGQSVARAQHISGIDFFYQPPPRHIVPYAASLKGHQSSSRRQGEGKRAGAGVRKPPTVPQKAGSLGRTTSLGTPAPAAVPPPSATLARSASLPHEQPSRSSSAGAGAGASRPDSTDSSQSSRARGRSPPKQAARRADSGHGGMRAAAPEWQGDASSAAAAPKMRRTVSEGLDDSAGGAGEQQGPPQALARSPQLDRDAVMRSVFGSASPPGAEGPPHAPLLPHSQANLPRHESGGVDLSLLLQQLALQEAQHQVSAALALAAQQPVRGRYQVVDQGYLLPASLSPLARSQQQLPPLSAVDAHLAAQGLANHADMLAAVAAAWQAQQSATSEQLLQHAVGGAHPPLGGRDVHASSAAGAPSAGARRSASLDGHHLSAFHPSSFAPFGSVGSPPSEGSAAGGSGALPGLQPPPDHAGPSTPAQPTPGAAAAVTPPQDPMPRPRQPSTSPPPSSEPLAWFTAGPVEPAGQQPSDSTPPLPFEPAWLNSGPLEPAGQRQRSGSAPPPLGPAWFSGGAAEPAAQRHQPASSFAGSAFAGFGPAPLAPTPRGDPSSALASAFALLPAGSGPMGEPAGPEGAALSASPFLSRAASVPDPELSTPLDRLHDMLELARANSYAAPGDPCTAGGPCAPAAGAAAGGPSAFTSAFSPARAAGLPLPPARREPLEADVQRLLDSMF